MKANEISRIAEAKNVEKADFYFTEVLKQIHEVSEKGKFNTTFGFPDDEKNFNFIKILEKKIQDLGYSVKYQPYFGGDGERDSHFLRISWEQKLQYSQPHQKKWYESLKNWLGWK